MSRFHQRTQTTSGATTGLALIFIFLAFCTYTIVQSRNDLAEQVPIALLLSTLCGYCTIVIWQEYIKRELFSPLSLFFATVLMHFGITALMYPDVAMFASPNNYKYFMPAVIYIIAFSAIFHTSYHFYATDVRYATRPTKMKWDIKAVWVVIATLVVAGLFGRALIIMWGIYLQTSLSTFDGSQQIRFIGTVRQLELFWNYASYISTIAYFSARQRGADGAARVFATVAVTLTLVNLLYWLPTGKKFPTISTIFIPLMIYYVYSKRLPAARYLIVVVAFVAALFPITHAYRTIQAQAISGQNVTDINSTINAIAASATRATSATEFGARNRTFGRLNQIEPVAGSIRILDEKIAPPRYGIDYFNVAVNMIPGFIWADKPRVMYGNEFGHMSEMIRTNDPFTAISVTLIGESFLNFHFVGAFVALFVSFIYFFLYRLQCIGVPRETAVLVYAGAVPTILYIGASFALYISALIQTTLLLLFLSVLMQRRDS